MKTIKLFNKYGVGIRMYETSFMPEMRKLDKFLQAWFAKNMKRGYEPMHLLAAAISAVTLGRSMVSMQAMYDSRKPKTKKGKP